MASPFTERRAPFDEDERVPPQEIEAEVAVLGSCLLNPEAIGLIAADLTPDDFSRNVHRQVYAAILACHERREPPDTLLVTSELERGGGIKGEVVGAFLAGLVGATPSAVHVEWYAGKVRHAARRRRLIQAGASIASLGYGVEDADDAFDRAQTLLMNLAPQRHRQAARKLDALLSDYVDRIAQAHGNGERPVGLLTGFRRVDELTGGFRPGSLVIVGGRPGSGKTSLALNIATYAALHFDKRVLVFSLEMGADELTHRLVCAQGGIDGQKIRAGYLGDADWGRIAEVSGTLSEARIWIDDSSQLTPLEASTKARRLQAEAGLDCVVIDYLQLMRAGRRTDNRVQEVSEISRSLKALARELNVPVLALCQLSRAVEQRPTARPMLSDLRDSGQIEADADLVGFLYRQELYDRETPRKGLAELIIAKNRHGALADIGLGFRAETTTFYDLEAEREAPPEAHGWRGD